MQELDSAKVAGLMVIGAVLILSAMRRGFGGVSVHVGS